MPGKMPEKKPFGRPEPPRNYPRNPEQYADPRNYMYPLDKPIRAKLARRYFDEMRNRNKYTEEERLFIDSRIDEALKRFGLASNDIMATSQPRIARRRPPSLRRKEDPDQLDLHGLLQRFLGEPRLERAESIPDNVVSLSTLGGEIISGTVKQYVVRIDLKNKIITHDCDDWKKNMRSKLMCKHLGKAFMVIGDGKASSILRAILTAKDEWTFNAP